MAGDAVTGLGAGRKGIYGAAGEFGMAAKGCGCYPWTSPAVVAAAGRGMFPPPHRPATAASAPSRGQSVRTQQGAAPGLRRIRRSRQTGGCSE
ncbi:hypothetical protein Axi01nite_59670 [Actinoplanes xinjiangensis]|nr:hypothetical protein Axi01nite_59670 [Actinoplanes xinjiangensis]